MHSFEVGWKIGSAPVDLGHEPEAVARERPQKRVVQHAPAVQALRELTHQVAQEPARSGSRLVSSWPGGKRAVLPPAHPAGSPNLGAVWVQGSR